MLGGFSGETIVASISSNRLCFTCGENKLGNTVTTNRLMGTTRPQECGFPENPVMPIKLSICNAI